MTKHHEWVAASVNDHPKKKPFATENGTPLLFKPGAPVICTNSYRVTSGRTVRAVRNRVPVSAEQGQCLDAGGESQLEAACERGQAMPERSHLITGDPSMHSPCTAPVCRCAPHGQTQPARDQTCPPVVHRGHSPASLGCDAGLQLFDHGFIQTASQARVYRSGELCIPGHAPQNVRIRFLNFQFNAVQDRCDAVYTVLRNGQGAGEYFASAFRHLWL